MENRADLGEIRRLCFLLNHRRQRKDLVHRQSQLLRPFVIAAQISRLRLREQTLDEGIRA